MPDPMAANVEGLNDALRMMRRLPREANAELRAAVQTMTDGHADAIRRAMAAWPDRRMQALAPSVRAARDRVPTINVGKAARLPISGSPRGVDVLYGAEFGAEQDGRNGWRFPPRTPPLGQGNRGHTIYPTLQDRQPAIVRDWEATVLRAVRGWER